MQIRSATTITIGPTESWMGNSWFHGNRSPLIYNLSYIPPIIVHPTTRSEGFEPPGLLHPSVFKTDALGHSANFSSNTIIADFGWKSTSFLQCCSSRSWRRRWNASRPERWSHWSDHRSIPVCRRDKRLSF